MLDVPCVCMLLCRMLNEYNVVLDAILLKPNMVLPGAGSKCVTVETVSVPLQLSESGSRGRQLSA